MRQDWSGGCQSCIGRDDKEESFRRKCGESSASLVIYQSINKSWQIVVPVPRGTICERTPSIDVEIAYIYTKSQAGHVLCSRTVKPPWSTCSLAKHRYNSTYSFTIQIKPQPHSLSDPPANISCSLNFILQHQLDPHSLSAGLTLLKSAFSLASFWPPWQPSHLWLASRPLQGQQRQQQPSVSSDSLWRSSHLRNH